MQGHVLTNMGVSGVIRIRKLIGAAAFAAVAIIWGTAAEATTLSFNFESDLYNYSWIMDSAPVASAHIVIGSNTATLAYTGQAVGSSVPLPAGGELFFYTASNGGGLSFVDGLTSLELFDVLGDQVYSGLETAPLFSIGTFLVPTDFNTNTNIHAVLTVAAVAMTPIPGALPLFASALGGLGFVGWRRKRATA
jgi:hypothetical protein